MLTWMAIKTEIFWMIVCRGSIIPSAYDMNTDSVPIFKTASRVRPCPCHSTIASAAEDIIATAEMRNAFTLAVCTETRRIFSVSSSNSFCILSSMPSSLMLLAPTIPSLKSPVIVELSSRMCRFRFTSFLWNSVMSTTAAAISRRIQSASLKSMMSMMMIAKRM